MEMAMVVWGGGDVVFGRRTRFEECGHQLPVSFAQSGGVQTTLSNQSSNQTAALTKALYQTATADVQVRARVRRPGVAATVMADMYGGL